MKPGVTRHPTSPPHAALGAEPLPLWDGLGCLANAAHVVCGGAAITAQQAAAKTTQHTQVSVAVLLKLWGWGSAPPAPPLLITVIIVFIVALHWG